MKMNQEQSFYIEMSVKSSSLFLSTKRLIQFQELIKHMLQAQEKKKYQSSFLKRYFWSILIIRGTFTLFGDIVFFRIQYVQRIKNR